MTHQRLGHQDEARQWYEKAAAWTSEVLAPASEDSTAKPSVAWNRRLTLELLQIEVSQQFQFWQFGIFYAPIHTPLHQRLNFKLKYAI